LSFFSNRPPAQRLLKKTRPLSSFLKRKPLLVTISQIPFNFFNYYISSSPLTCLLTYQSPSLLVTLDDTSIPTFSPYFGGQVGNYGSSRQHSICGCSGDSTAIRRTHTRGSPAAGTQEAERSDTELRRSVHLLQRGSHSRTRRFIVVLHCLKYFTISF